MVTKVRTEKMDSHFLLLNRARYLFFLVSLFRSCVLHCISVVSHRMGKLCQLCWTFSADQLPCRSVRRFRCYGCIQTRMFRTADHSQREAVVAAPVTTQGGGFGISLHFPDNHFEQHNLGIWCISFKIWGKDRKSWWQPISRERETLLLSGVWEAWGL